MALGLPRYKVYLACLASWLLYPELKPGGMSSRRAYDQLFLPHWLATPIREYQYKRTRLYSLC